MDALLEVRKALNDKITALGYAVFDNPPTNRAYPFVMLGNDRVGQLDVKNSKYLNVSATVLIFSNYDGRKEANDIMQNIIESVWTLQLETYKIVGIFLEEATVFYDKDNQLNQGVIVYTIKIVK